MFEDKEGNNTVSTDDVIQRYYYYPFGAETENTPWTQHNNPEIRYQYNGKEKITELGLGWNDYGARNYDALLGRWMGVDALAEKYMVYNPYVYCLGNPVRFIDPDGRKVIVGNIYEEDENCKPKYKTISDAFKAFATSKVGIAFLSNFAEKGQTIEGVTYNKDGKFHKKNINFSIEAVMYCKNINNDSRSGQTLTSLNEKGLNINMQIDCDGFGQRDWYLGTMCHEAFIHAESFGDDYLKDGKLDFSNFSLERRTAYRDEIKSGLGARVLQHDRALNHLEEFYSRCIPAFRNFYKLNNLPQKSEDEIQRAIGTFKM
jgi:RHS repeat-associated protein